MNLILAAAVVWVFAVDVTEQWPRYHREPRSMGGWTHNGPYKTKAECESARHEMLAKPYAYHDEAHTVWHTPRECRAEDAARVRALHDAELEMMRRGR